VYLLAIGVGGPAYHLAVEAYLQQPRLLTTVLLRARR
jgi:hypothetical protein